LSVEAVIPSRSFAVHLLACLLCWLAPGLVFAESDEEQGADDEEQEADDEDARVDASDDALEGEAPEPTASEGSISPDWDLSAQELAELEALEIVEANDGLASSHRIQVLRRKRARLAKKALKATDPAAAHSQWALGFRATGLASLHKGESPIGVGGIGGFVEVAAVHGELELELAARLLFEEGHLQIPIQLLFKKPWDIKGMRFFIGVGPAVILGIPVGEEDPPAAESEAPEDVHFGFSGVAGLTWWMRPRVGLTGELNYNIVVDNGARHEPGVSVGVVFAL